MPTSLFGRSLLIVVLPLLLLQAISMFIFYNSHWENVGRRLALGLGGEISMLVAVIEKYPAGAQRDWMLSRAQGHLTMRVRILESKEVPEGHKKRFSALDKTLSRVLPEQISRPFAFDSSKDDHVTIWVGLEDGVLEVRVSRKRLFSSTTYVFLAWMVGTSLILLTIAVYFLRRQIRPIRRLAQAADSFGKAMQVVAFKPEGAREVRQAANAFLLMRERIRRQITQRTEMLAGVSHDLRTPLTRMKLQLAMLPEGDYSSGLRNDVLEMEKMVDGYLAFARGEGSEKAVPVYIDTMLTDVVEEARRAGADVILEELSEAQLMARPNALKRAITNLIDNASRYGYEVSLAARKSPDALEISIDDNGPGIPESHRESVFKPFFRMDQSRNAETGGVGLGLTIARDVVRNHGGDLVLSESSRGGVSALIRLPL